MNYENEREVGEAVRRSGLPRDELRVASKIPGRHHAYDDAVAQRARARWSGSASTTSTCTSSTGPTRASAGTPRPGGRWSTSSSEGLVRSIGVSNFTEAHLTRIIDETGVTPAVNQVELHPYFPQAQHARPSTSGSASGPSRGARWASGRRRSRSRRWPAAAERTASRPARSILRWQVQLGAVPIPKSATRSVSGRTSTSSASRSTDDEVDAITALGRPDGRLFGGDPDVHEEM